MNYDRQRQLILDTWQVIKHELPANTRGIEVIVGQQIPQIEIWMNCSCHPGHWTATHFPAIPLGFFLCMRGLREAVIEVRRGTHHDSACQSRLDNFVSYPIWGTQGWQLAKHIWWGHALQALL